MDITRLTGYAGIKLSGLSIERDIKKILAAGIVLHDCRRESYTVLTARVSFMDVRKIRKMGIKVKRCYRGGLLPAMYNSRARYGLFAGFAIVIAAVVLLAGRVFVFDITGLENVKDQDIMNVLTREGLTPGVRVSGERLDQIERILIKENDKLQWVSMTQRGVNINITVKEKLSLPQADYKTPGDLVAGKTALVEEVTVLQGMAAVKKGQLVLPGQVLISGQLVYGEQPAEYVAAMGYCKARVWYTLEDTVPLEKEVRTPTGRTFVTERIVIMGQTFGGERAPYKDYSSTSEISPVTRMGVPIYVERITYTEEAVSTVNITPEEALEEMKPKLSEALDPTLPEGEESQVLNITYSVSEDDGKAIVTICAEVLERIEVFKPLEQQG